MEALLLSPIARHTQQTEIYQTPELVRGLSLHDVTQQYGTEGLYTRLKLTLEDVGLADHPDVTAATQLGLILHNNDARTNGHYADHLLRVTLRIIEQYQILDPALIAAAMLHDSIEDHDIELVKMVTGEEIEDVLEARRQAHILLGLIVGQEAADIIKDVTNDIRPFGVDKNRFYTTKTFKTVARSPKGRVLKLSDFTDNAIGNHYTMGPKQNELDYKYLGSYAVHAMGLFLPDSLITGNLRLELLEKIKLGLNRTTYRLLHVA